MSLALPLANVGGQVNLGNSVNRHAGLNRGRVAWYIALPGVPKANRWLDLVGNYHGTFVNGAAFTSGRNTPGGVYGAMFCDYTAVHHMTIGDLTSHFGASEATFNVWLKRVDNTPGSTAATGSWTLNASDSSCHYPYTDGNIYDGTFRTARITVGAGLVDRSQWHMVTISRKAGANGWNFYQNAAVASSQDGGTFEIATSLKIGESALAGSYLFNGWMDDVSIWNRALSADEVALLYNASRTGYQNELNWIRPVGLGVEAQAPATSFSRPLVNWGLVNGGLINAGLVA